MDIANVQKTHKSELGDIQSLSGTLEQRQASRRYFEELMYGYEKLPCYHYSIYHTLESAKLHTKTEIRVEKLRYPCPSYPNLSHPSIHSNSSFQSVSPICARIACYFIMLCFVFCAYKYQSQCWTRREVQGQQNRPSPSTDKPAATARHHQPPHRYPRA